MIAFARFGTRFSVSESTPAKVAKVETVGAELSQLSRVSRQGKSKPENATSSPMALQAARIIDSIAEDARREDDPDGWLVLVLPDGRRHVVAPHIVDALGAAGLMPDLPPTVSRSTSASTARPPSWSDPTDAPLNGDHCCLCGSGRWWTAAPTQDGWCCSACHPPSPGRTVREVITLSATASGQSPIET